MTNGKSYFRVMLGEKSMFADQCFAGCFIATDFYPQQDLTDVLPDDWRRFNQKFIPIYQKMHPRRTRSAPDWRVALCGPSRRALKKATWCSAPTAQVAIAWAG